MRVLFVGDTHGNEPFVRKLAAEATRQTADVVVQVGDFGYWEHNKNWGKRFLKVVSDAAKETGVPWYFIDGNHENHPLLWKTYTERDDEGFIKVRPFLSYIPRGHVWQWDGKTFLGLGGAYSIDQEWRIPGRSYWPTEIIRDADVSTALKAVDKIDVLVSHDAPSDVNIPCLAAQDKWNYPGTVINRDKLQVVMQVLLPTLIVHGHYHERYSSELSFPLGVVDDQLDWHRIQIEGLAADPTAMGDQVADSSFYLPGATWLYDTKENV